MDNHRHLLKKVYFLSGLGADKRVFSLLDLSFCEPIFIDWIKPFKRESLEQYAFRMQEQIKDDNALIVGISFGGMLVTEMAKADKTLKAIIISSNTTHKELPGYFRIGKILPAYKLFPATLLKKSAFLFRKWLGAEGEKQKIIIQEILSDTDPGFLKWAMSAILNWRNTTRPENVTHIHGTADKVLPYRLVKADYTIAGGTHVMPLDKQDEISTLLKKLIIGS